MLKKIGQFYQKNTNGGKKKHKKDIHVYKIKQIKFFILDQKMKETPMISLIMQLERSGFHHF